MISSPPSRDRADSVKKPARWRQYFTVAIILFVLAALGVVFPIDAASRTVVPETPVETSASRFEWEAVDDGVKIVKLLDRGATKVDVPAKIDDKPVVEIGANAFFGCESLSSLSLPDGV